MSQPSVPQLKPLDWDPPPDEGRQGEVTPLMLQTLALQWETDGAFITKTEFEQRNSNVSPPKTL